MSDEADCLIPAVSKIIWYLLPAGRLGSTTPEEGLLGSFGITDPDAPENAPAPALLTAATRNRYEVPFVSPVIVADVALETV
jgi:hypothetical protein